MLMQWGTTNLKDQCRTLWGMGPFQPFEAQDMEFDPRYGQGAHRAPWRTLEGKRTAYWLDNTTRDRAAPTMKPLKELGGGVGMRDAFRPAISGQDLSDLAPEMARADWQAGLKAMTYQPDRNNAAVVLLRDFLLASLAKTGGRV